MTPIEPLSGKKFEELILFRGRKMNDSGAWDMGRCGVEVRYITGDGGKLEARPVKSLPDFDAAVSPDGRQVIIEAKACSQASYPIAAEYKKKPRQIDHMIRRARCGAWCYLMIHFNGRTLTKRVEDAFTVAIPIHNNSELISDMLRGGTKTLSRNDASLYGVPITWNCAGRDRKVSPDMSVLIDGSLATMFR